MIDRKKFPCEQLRFYRNYRGISREELAVQLSIPAGSITNFEKGFCEIQYDHYPNTAAWVLPGRSEKQLNKLLQLHKDLNNKSRLWCNCGWTPEELSAMRHPKRPAVHLFWLRLDGRF
jgi:transcriptional regulator with XRE-family HTH domain